MLVYVQWLIVFMFIPLGILLFVNWNLVVRYKKTILFSVLLFLIFGVPLDVWGTYKGVWIYPTSGVLGIYILNLPLEEYFFIICEALIVSIFTLMLRVRLTLKRTVRK